MKRIVSIIIATVLLLVALPLNCFASTSYTRVAIKINGVMQTDLNAYLIDNYTYVPFREFLSSKDIIGASVYWDQKNKTATAVGDVTIKASVGAKYITINGKKVNSNAANKLIIGRLYIPARSVAEALGYSVKWISKTKTVELSKTYSYDNNTADLENSAAYSDEDLYWLSRLIYAEAVGQPYNGMIAVGNVIMNRVRSNEYPSTVYDVMFDKKYGTQFTPTENGSIYNTPNDECIKAAKEVLEGYSLNDKIIYFVNHDLSNSSWFYTRTFVFKIGDHSFYY